MNWIFWLMAWMLAIICALYINKKLGDKNHEIDEMAEKEYRERVKAIQKKKEGRYIA
jgi:hypothetical protein